MDYRKMLLSVLFKLNAPKYALGVNIYTESFSLRAEYKHKKKHYTRVLQNIIIL